MILEYYLKSGIIIPSGAGTDIGIDAAAGAVASLAADDYQEQCRRFIFLGSEYVNILNTISELWQEEKLPVINGLIKSNGTFYEFDADERSLLKTANLHSGNYRKKFSSIIITVSRKHLDVNYYCGEGSHGSDGWVLAINSDDSIAWLFFDYVNPFEKMWIENDEIRCMSNLNTEWIFPISKPEQLYSIKHGF